MLDVGDGWVFDLNTGGRIARMLAVDREKRYM
jgi:hypothetical protein